MGVNGHAKCMSQFFCPPTETAKANHTKGESLELDEGVVPETKVSTFGPAIVGDGDGVENAVTRDVGDARNPEPLHTPVPTPTDPEVPTGAKEDGPEVAAMAPNTARWTRTRDSLEDGRG